MNRLFWLVIAGIVSAMERTKGNEDGCGCCTALSEKKGLPGGMKLIFLRENLAGQVQILLQGKNHLGSSFDEEKAKRRGSSERSKPKKVKIVVETSYKLPKSTSGTDYLSVVSKILGNYHFGQPCITTGQVEGVLVIGDCVNGFFAEPSAGYEWVLLRSVLGGRVKVKDDLAGMKINWESAYRTLNFLPFDEEKEDDSSGELAEKYCPGNNKKRKGEASHDGRVPILLLPMRIGPFGRVEVLLARHKTVNRLTFIECSKPKRKKIHKCLGMQLDSKAPLLRKKSHLDGEPVQVILCRIDQSHDGFSGPAFGFSQKDFLWRDLKVSVENSAGRTGELRRVTSSDRLDVNSIEVLHEIDEHFGGFEGWSLVFKALRVGFGTPSHLHFESEYHHQYHDHHHLGHHHHIHLGLPHMHNHHHGCGKQHLVAVWRGTDTYLMSHMMSVKKAKLLEYKLVPDEKAFQVKWNVAIASDLLDVVHDLCGKKSEKLLVIGMMDLDNPLQLVRSGIESLSSELLRRTSLSLSLNQLDRKNDKTAVLLRGIRVIRSSQSGGYEYRGEIKSRLDAVLLDQFGHLKHHSLCEEDMQLLVARLYQAFRCASEGGYSKIVLSIGRHEWEGIRTHCLLEAVKRAQAKVLFEAEVVFAIVLDCCFDEADREDVESIMNLETL